MEPIELALVLVVGVIIIATVSALAPKVGVAGPLVLVAIGVGISLLPFVPPIELEAELILIGILPPLLYGAAVSLPAMEFRRDFGAIGGLSVILVLVSSLILGVFFTLVIPGMNLALAIALGAILSPTDAVATSIVRKLGISPRVVTVLEGESLLNDATALVLLRTAIAATAGSFSLWQGIGEFSWAVAVAVVVGLVIGWLNLRVRAWIPSTAAATALSFVVPYLAYIPAEELHGSGLVAAVVAGIVTGQGSARHFTAEQRLSDRVNWHTIELLLEGSVFLIMGLEVQAIIDATGEGMQGLGHAAAIAAVAGAIVLAVRAAYIAPVLFFLSRRSRRSAQMRPQLEAFQSRWEEAPDELKQERIQSRRRKQLRNPERATARWTKRLRTVLADATYYETTPLGWREGIVLVWAGMRGAVTLAAAQTLPAGTPQRALLVLIAFLVAVGTLVIQGGTLALIVKALGLGASRENESGVDEVEDLRYELRTAALDAISHEKLHRLDGTPFDEDLVRIARERWSDAPEADQSARTTEILHLRLVMIDAERVRLAELRKDGRYSTATLRSMLEALDAEELSVRTRVRED